MNGNGEWIRLNGSILFILYLFKFLHRSLLCFIADSSVYFHVYINTLGMVLSFLVLGFMLWWWYVGGGLANHSKFVSCFSSVKTLNWILKWLVVNICIMLFQFRDKILIVAFKCHIFVIVVSNQV